MNETLDPENNLLTELIASQQAGKPVALATVIRARGSVPRHVGSKMLIHDDGRVSSTIGGGEMEARVIEEALAALNVGEPRIVPYSLVDPAKGDPGVCGGEVEVYIEPYLSPATVLVIGGGHVGRAVVRLSAWLGFRVAVYDDRSELATPEQAPGANIYLQGDIEDALATFTITNQTYIVVVTRNVLVDRHIIPVLLKKPAPYIGVIGSRRRWEESKRLLLEDGLNEEQLSRCHSPIGLELKAETPAEIAVSILAEIIMARRGGSGKRMASSESIDPVIAGKSQQ